MVELAKAIKLPLTGDLNKDKYLFAKEIRKRLSNKIGINTLSEQGVDIKDLDMLAEDVLKEPGIKF